MIFNSLTSAVQHINCTEVLSADQRCNSCENRIHKAGGPGKRHVAIDEVKKEIIKFCLANKEELHGYAVIKTLLNHGLFEEAVIFAQKSDFAPALFR